MTATQHFPVGSLVHARGREWVVLPDSNSELLVLRPLGGGDDDIAGVLRGIEHVEHATFTPPSPEDLGDDRSARLLRDALRIGFRSSAGPFRSLAGLAVDPRPYQLVPLLLALRQHLVRLLIADDVGIGKTIEAGLVAAELLAQGSARGLAVLCPPSLAEQWQSELRTKFNLDAELVLPGTVTRLERGLEYGQSLFERHPITVVSTDFIKADRRRDDFLRAAPDLLIVDEAHTCVSDGPATNVAGGANRGRTQRFRLLQDLARDRSRHLILVTATPHSGKEEAFRNLIGLLDPTLHDADLATDPARQRLAEHMVQRRRGDIRKFLGDTRFPRDRETKELDYRLSPPYRELFDDVLDYVRGRVRDTTGTRLEQRVRWWSALSLLRALASSPAAAAATLKTRAVSAEASSVEAADEMGRSTVLDPVEDEAIDSADLVAGAVVDPAPTSREARVLSAFRKRALDLPAEQDVKLSTLTTRIRTLHRDGFQPIVFCRFIQTAHYVAEHLREQLGRVDVEAVTGELAPEDRAARVQALLERGASSRVLVATDCLSEGVNLQEGFQAVVHYDLAWNPTRHEQREGRVDRFGQPADIVRAVTIYGSDNGIDGMVLDVLLRKHQAISRDLGISVPVPSQSDQVLAALVEGVLLRSRDTDQLTLDFDADRQRQDLHEEWESTAAAERQTRTRYAQRSIHDEDVIRELTAARQALGSPDDVYAFTRAALEECGAQVLTEDFGFTVQTQVLPVGLRETLSPPNDVIAFYRDLPAPRTAAVLHRTDTKVGAVARYVLDAALDPMLAAFARPARRCGVIRTATVTAPTTAVLARFRFHLTLPGRDGQRVQVAEEARVLAFTGQPTDPSWLDPDAVEELLMTRAGANVPPDAARNMAAAVLTQLSALTPHLEPIAGELATTLRDSHVRVRRAARGRQAGALGVAGLTVSAQLPVDVLGVYVYLPVGGTR
ncbi:MAG: helicase-related protein [Pseudonocardiaceae bacterium]